jgi:hypothetical protein
LIYAETENSHPNSGSFVQDCSASIHRPDFVMAFSGIVRARSSAEACAMAAVSEKLPAATTLTPRPSRIGVNLVGVATVSRRADHHVDAACYCHEGVTLGGLVG